MDYPVQYRAVPAICYNYKPCKTAHMFHETSRSRTRRQHAAHCCRMQVPLWWVRPTSTVRALTDVTATVTAKPCGCRFSDRGTLVFQRSFFPPRMINLGAGHPKSTTHHHCACSCPPASALFPPRLCQVLPQAKPLLFDVDSEATSVSAGGRHVERSPDAWTERFGRFSAAVWLGLVGAGSQGGRPRRASENGAKVIWRHHRLS